MSGYERFGWMMFALSGVFFLVVGFQNRDWLTIAGAVVWMIGCASFLLGAGRQ